jgi:hypothetical protein
MELVESTNLYSDYRVYVGRNMAFLPTVGLQPLPSYCCLHLVAPRAQQIGQLSGLDLHFINILT